MRNRALLVALAMLAAWTPRAFGEEMFFNNYCTVGMFQTCVSVHVETGITMGGQHFVRVKMWNREGLGGFGDPSAITSLGLWHEPQTGYNVQALSLTVREINPSLPGGYRDLDNWQRRTTDVDGNLGTVKGGISAEVGSFSIGGVQGIAGCSDVGGFGSDLVHTCDSDGVTNSFPNETYVEFFFIVDSEFYLENLQFGYLAHHVDFGSDACDTTAGADDKHICTVIPEPVTMVLLGTGLFGLGGASFIRRRRRGLEVEDA